MDPKMPFLGISVAPEHRDSPAASAWAAPNGRSSQLSGGAMAEEHRWTRGGGGACHDRGTGSAGRRGASPCPTGGMPQKCPEFPRASGRAKGRCVCAEGGSVASHQPTHEHARAHAHSPARRERRTRIPPLAGRAARAFARSPGAPHAHSPARRERRTRIPPLAGSAEPLQCSSHDPPKVLRLRRF